MTMASILKDHVLHVLDLIRLQVGIDLRKLKNGHVRFGNCTCPPMSRYCSKHVLRSYDATGDRKKVFFFHGKLNCYNILQNTKLAIFAVNTS